MKINLKSYLPILEWGKDYTSKIAVNDLVVAVIVTIMLIPQSLAYAQLAGLPPEVGLYASMAPLIMYAIFGTSRSLSVGPVACISLMTLAAVAPIATAGTSEYLAAAMTLALLTGFFLIILRILQTRVYLKFYELSGNGRTGHCAWTPDCSKPADTDSGNSMEGGSFLPMIISVIKNIDQINIYTAVIGVSAVIFLLLVKKYLVTILTGIGLGKGLAGILAKMGPVIAIVITMLIVSGLGLEKQGVKIVGEVPQGLPGIVFPPFDLELWSQLATPAILIAVLSYVGSISVAQTLASKKRQHIDPNQELLALGAANIGASMFRWLPSSRRFFPIDCQL